MSHTLFYVCVLVCAAFQSEGFNSHINFSTPVIVVASTPAQECHDMCAPQLVAAQPTELGGLQSCNSQSNPAPNTKKPGRAGSQRIGAPNKELAGIKGARKGSNDEPAAEEVKNSQTSTATNFQRSKRSQKKRKGSPRCLHWCSCIAMAMQEELEPIGEGAPIGQACC